jgi:uncharacterized protein
MSKLLLLLLLGALAYLLVRGLKRHARPPAHSRDADGRTPPPAAERMVICVRCRIHLPESEAIESAGRHYCCEEHRAADR